MSKRRWNDVNEVLDILFSNSIAELTELADTGELGGDDAELEEDIAEIGSDEYGDDDYDPIGNLHGSPKAEDVCRRGGNLCTKCNSNIQIDTTRTKNNNNKFTA